MKKVFCLILVIASASLANAQRGVQDSLADFDYVHFKEHLSQLKRGTDKNEYLNKIQRDFIKRKYNLLKETVCKSDKTTTSSCGNLDFEDGNVAGWTMTGDFQIMSGSAVDPFGGFPVVCPGGNFSLRLNDNNTTCSGPTPKTGFNSSAYNYIAITATNSIVKVNFAACLLEFPHPVNAAAFLKIEFFDQLNNPIPTPTFSALYASPPNSVVATNATTYSTSLTQGAQICSSVGSYPVKYFPWQTQIFNLSSYVGQNVKIKLTANWCLYNYDWGYAYFDVCCDSSCPIMNNPNFSSTTVTNFCMAGLFETEVCSAYSNGTNYQWTSTSVDTLSCATVISMGSYTLVSNPLSNPSFTVNEIFNFYPPPKVNFNLPTNIACSNSSSGISLIGAPPGGIFSGPGVTTSSFDPWLVANGTYTITYVYTDSISGCSASATQTISVITCTTTGIKSNTKQTEFNIAPNPFKDEILIGGRDIPNDAEFILFNCIGQEILRKRLTETKNTIDTEGIPQGLYIYSIEQQNKPIKQGKLVKD